MSQKQLTDDVLRDAILKSEATLSADPAARQEPQPKRDHGLMHKLGLPLMAAGQTADVVSTVQALKRGAHESNPVYGKQPSAAKLTAIKAATMVPTGLLLDKLYTHHPKIAMGIAAAIGGLGFGVAARNAKQGRKP
jgi:hypothetical protein